MDPTSKELLYNPKAEELYAPTLGPDCPFKTGQQRAHRNTVAGFVEPAHLSEFQFEAQRKTFTSFGLYTYFLICFCSNNLNIDVFRLCPRSNSWSNSK